MQRYFIQDQQIMNQKAIINGNDVHHMLHVMRFSPGQQVILNTYEGQVYLAEITELNKDEVLLDILKTLDSISLGYHLDLGLSLTKRDAFELALKKATELGVTGFLPLETEHSMIKIKDFEKKRQRYFTICKESSEQSERPTIPKIYDLSDILSLRVDGYDQLLFAYARQGELGPSLWSFIQTIPNQDKTLCLIGPEGGFSKQEVLALKKKGFISVSLGNTILRAETAAIYVASAFRLRAGVKK